MEERLQAVVSQAETDGKKWHTIIHGDNTTTVSTENGNVPTVAKQMADVRAEVIKSVADYLGQCQTAKNETLQIKAETLSIKTQTETLKAETLALRNETETYKDLAQTTFNSIASATTASVAQVQTEGQTQIALATAQADRAEQASDSKLNIDCSNINLSTILSAFGATSNAGSNVLKFPLLLPDGAIRTIIIQFGVKYCGSDGDTSLTFNETFPNAYLTGQATFGFAVNTGSDGALAIYNATRTGAILRNGSNWAGNVNWLAIGY